MKRPWDEARAALPGMSLDVRGVSTGTRVAVNSARRLFDHNVAPVFDSDRGDLGGEPRKIHGPCAKCGFSIATDSSGRGVTQESPYTSQGAVWTVALLRD